MDVTRTRLLPLILAVFIITLPLIPSSFTGLALYGYGQIIYTLYTLIILSIILLVLGLGKKQKWIAKINVIDIILTIYLITCLFNILLIRKLEIDPVCFFKYSALTLIYIMARNLNSHTIIYNAVIISGCVQSCITFGQHFGIVASRHELFPVTGTFDNPGPLGWYLAISLIISVLLLTGSLKQKQRSKGFLYIFAVTLIGAALITTSSRAAWLSVGIALFYFLYKWLCTTIKPVYRTIFILTVFVGIISGCKLLYDIQPESAKARLLIWNVSATMLAEKPLSGHGTGAFGEKYMIYQATYFENNPESSFSLVADNPLYAYNEIINIGVEQGIIGLLIIFVLIFTVFLSKHTRCSGNTLPQTALLGWLIFCLFSYPSDVFPILTLLPVLMAFIHSTSIVQICINAKTMITCICFFVGLLAITIHFHYRARNISAITIPVSGSNSKNQVSDIDISLFIHNQKIRAVLPVYARISDKSLYKRVEEVAGSYDSYMYLGDLYMDKCAYKESEYYYKMASNMIPNRMRPNYCLWNLAVKSDNMGKAVYYANKIINQPIKVSNTFTIRTKSQMIQFLKEHETVP